MIWLVWLDDWSLTCTCCGSIFWWSVVLAWVIAVSPATIIGRYILTSSGYKRFKLFLFTFCQFQMTCFVFTVRKQWPRVWKRRQNSTPLLLDLFKPLMFPGWKISRNLSFECNLQELHWLLFGIFLESSRGWNVRRRFSFPPPPPFPPPPLKLPLLPPVPVLLSLSFCSSHFFIKRVI